MLGRLNFVIPIFKEGHHNGFCSGSSKSQLSTPEANGELRHLGTLGSGDTDVIRILEGGFDLFVDVKPFLAVNHPRFVDANFHFPSGKSRRVFKFSLGVGVPWHPHFSKVSISPPMPKYDTLWAANLAAGQKSS
jgi:hypothetical protein